MIIQTRCNPPGAVRPKVRFWTPISRTIPSAYLSTMDYVRARIRTPGSISGPTAEQSPISSYDDAEKMEACPAEQRRPGVL